MARYTGPVCRLCKREGMKLYLKGGRCFTDKCPVKETGEKNFISPPGDKPKRYGRRRTNYGVQLREKQKVKRIYGVLEEQFKNYFYKAEKSKGVTGEILLSFLERRLDNVVYRLGLTESRSQARQLVTHGHFLINGKKVNIPSYILKNGDRIEVREKSKKLPPILSALEQENVVPKWLSFDKKKMTGTLVELPKREDIIFSIKEHLIVELYSK